MLVFFKRNLQYISFLIFFQLFSACESEYTPKPRGYYRIDFPKKEYNTYNSDCHFSFEFPLYAAIIPYMDSINEPCWLNCNFPAFAARIHLSYKPVYNINGLDTLIEDSRNFVYKHTIKADAIDEIFIQTNNNVNGMFYEIDGNTASSIQFFLTDSISHFLRGALYFNTEPNADSLSPVINFIKEDIWVMINSLKWQTHAIEKINK